MPRPRHPIREHFHEIPDSSRKNGAIACNYCGKEQSAGNPKRCQKHLDECSQYATVLAVVDAGGEPNFPLQSPYDSAASTPVHPQSQYPSAPPQQDGLPTNTFPSTPAPGGPIQTAVAVGTPERVMSEDNIMRALRLNDATYLAIERELDAQLQHLNISGAGLHTGTGRVLLKQAFYQVHQRWPEVFNDIHEQDKTQALTAMANICNRKRRNGAPPSAGPFASPTVSNLKTDGRPSMSSSMTAAGAMQHLQQQQPKGPVTPNVPVSIFGTTMIIADRADRADEFCICRPGDLTEQLKPAEDININDVKFIPWVRLLQQDQDVMFNPEVDKIMFTFAGNRTKTVANEVVWRAALEDMHKRGTDPFVFKIYKRDSV